jgi:hypothetical protein
VSKCRPLFLESGHSRDVLECIHMQWLTLGNLVKGALVMPAVGIDDCKGNTPFVYSAPGLGLGPLFDANSQKLR